MVETGVRSTFCVGGGFGGVAGRTGAAAGGAPFAGTGAADDEVSFVVSIISRVNSETSSPTFFAVVTRWWSSLLEDADLIIIAC